MIFLEKIPYLEKLLFLRYVLKSSQPIRFQDFLINHISRTNHWNSLFFCMLIQIDINLLIKKCLGGHVASLVMELQNISRMNIGGTNWGNGQNIVQKWFVLSLKKNLLINIQWIYSVMEFFLFALFLHNSYNLEKFYSWYINQNAFSQSDCRVFKSFLSF